MTTGITVNVPAICERPLKLFVNGHNAWDHMRDHALGMMHNGEEQGWALLIPALEDEVNKGQLADLRSVARAESLNTAHLRLGPIYSRFLNRVKRGVEHASQLDWFWEERPGSGCRWKTLGHEGIFAALDEDYVRTGFLLESDPTKWAGNARRATFRLFLACLKRVQAKYNGAFDRGQIEKLQPGLDTVFRSGLTEDDWDRGKPSVPPLKS